MAEPLPNYCPHDGTELTTDRSDIGSRARCPTCDDRWYPSPWKQVAWRLPPQVRQWWGSVDSPQKNLRVPSPGIEYFFAVLLATATAFAVVGFVRPDAPSWWTEFGGTFILAWLTRTAAVPVHEWLHQRALCWLGVKSQIRYEPLLFWGLPIGIRKAVTLPNPYSWRARPWEQAVVAMAPLLLALSGLSVATVTDIVDLSPFFESLFIGVGVGLFWAGIPSESDILIAFSTERYWIFGSASRAPEHRAAEGIE